MTSLVAFVLLVVAGNPAAEAQAPPQPQRPSPAQPPGPSPGQPPGPSPAPPPPFPARPQPGTETVPPAAPGEPREPVEPTGERPLPLLPSGRDRLAPPRSDLLTRVLTGLDPSQAGPGWYVIPSLSLRGVYDSNIFGRGSDREGDVAGTTSSREGDVYARAAPALGLGYLSDRFRIFGAYSTSAELYADHSELNDAAATQTGRLELGYAPTPVLSFTLDGSYHRADNSIRVPQETGVVAVEVGRQELSVLRLGSSASYEFSALTSGEASYQYTLSDVSEEATSQSHYVALRLARSLSPLARGTLSYGIGLFESEEGDEEAIQTTTSTTHSVLVGYQRQLGPATDVLLEVGPRFSQGDVGADVGVDARVGLTQRLPFGTLWANYTRGQTVVAGLTTPRTTDTLGASIGFEPVGPFHFTLSSTVSRISEEDAEGSTDLILYTGGAGVTYALRSWAILNASYQFIFQDNTERITRHIVSVGVEFSYPVRVY